MKITQETIEYVAALAKLSFSEDEKIQAKKDLENILGYIETMQELDTESVEPLTHMVQRKNVVREDSVKESMRREQILKNAPIVKDGCFSVPKTVES